MSSRRTRSAATITTCLQTTGRVKIGIGDVTGHGLESGVLMLMVQSVARALQENGGDDPHAFLEVLNRAIYKNIERTEVRQAPVAGLPRL